jgi:hypothetical protein
MDVLALISSADQRGGKTADLPPWISLKDIQQGRTKWRCFLPVCICVLSSVPLFKTFQRFLFHTYRLLQSRQDAARAICETPESLVYHILQQIHLPLEPGAQTAFKLGGQTCLIPALAPASPRFYPTEVEFSILFQYLSIDHIVKVSAEQALVLAGEANSTCLAGLRILADGEESSAVRSQQGRAHPCGRNLPRAAPPVRVPARLHPTTSDRTFLAWFCRMLTSANSYLLSCQPSRCWTL